MKAKLFDTAMTTRLRAPERPARLEMPRLPPPAVRASSAHLQAAVAAAQAKMPGPPAAVRPPAAHVQAAVAGAAQAKPAQLPRPGTAAHVRSAVAQTKAAGLPRASPPLRPPAAPPSQTVQGCFPGGLAGVVQAARRGGAIQAKLEGTAVRLPPGHVDLRASGAGQPIPEAVRQPLEAAFGTDFSDVRIHSGRQAASIGALAFTHGSQIHFAPGQYDPGSPAGLRLLAHELTHVVQQRAGRLGHFPGQGFAVVQDPRLEAEAERMAARLAVQPCVQPSVRLKTSRTAGVVQPYFYLKGPGGGEPRIYDRGWVKYTLSEDVKNLTDAELDAEEARGVVFSDVEALAKAFLDRRAAGEVKDFKALPAPAPTPAPAQVRAPERKLDDPRLVRSETGSSGGHHPIHYFTFGDEEKEGLESSFDLDTWSNKKTGLKAIWPKKKKEQLLNGIAAWNFKRCLAFDLLNQGLEFAVKAGRKDLFMLFSSLQHSLALRIKDIDSNCPGQVTIQDGKNIVENIPIDWTRVLSKAREKVKAALDSKEAVPGDHHEVKFASAAVMDCDDPGLKKLREAKFVSADATLNTEAVPYRVQGAPRAKAMKAKGPKKPNFNFGVGHLRYLIFLEWRVLKEMLDSVG